jgi:hypothetical protein
MSVRVQHAGVHGLGADFAKDSGGSAVDIHAQLFYGRVRKFELSVKKKLCAPADAQVQGLAAVFKAAVHVIELLDF